MVNILRNSICKEKEILFVLLDKYEYVMDLFDVNNAEFRDIPVLQKGIKFPEVLRNRMIYA